MGIRAWEQGGEPEPLGTLTPVLLAQPWAQLELHSWSAWTCPTDSAPPCDTSYAHTSPQSA